MSHWVIWRNSLAWTIEAIEGGAGVAEKARATTSGTFSARAAEAIGASKPVVDAIVKTGKDNLDMLRRMLDQMREGTGGLA